MAPKHQQSPPRYNSNTTTTTAAWGHGARNVSGGTAAARFGPETSAGTAATTTAGSSALMSFSGRASGAASAAARSSPSSPATPAMAAAARRETLRRLQSPPPVSFALQAAVLLLPDMVAGQTVYLMDRSYLINWLIWCLHQPVAPVVTTAAAAAASSASAASSTGSGSGSSGVGSESSRLNTAVRLAAAQLQPRRPTPAAALGMAYTQPGPVNASTLSVLGHPLLLDATVRVYGEGAKGSGDDQDDAAVAEAEDYQRIMLLGKNRALPLPPTQKLSAFGGLRAKSVSSTAGGRNSKYHAAAASVAAAASAAFDRVRSAPMENGDAAAALLDCDDDDDDESDDSKYCVAVPEPFYELLRRVHGVLCDDFTTVSFQPSYAAAEDTNAADHECILQHHVYQHGHKHPDLPHQTANAATVAASPPRPIEFRRRLVWQSAAQAKRYGKAVKKKNTAAAARLQTQQQQQPSISLMQQLLLEEKSHIQRLVVEVHPLKLFYTLWQPPPSSDTNTVADSDADFMDDDAAASSASTTTATNGVYRQQQMQQQQQRPDSATKAPPQPTPPHRIFSGGGDGFCLVSRDAPAVAVVAALQRMAAPRQASQSVRTWTKWEYHHNCGTNSKNSVAGAAAAAGAAAFDGYELVDMDILAEELPAEMPPPGGEVPGRPPQAALVRSAGAWLDQHHAGPDVKELQVLVETRRTDHTPWPRAPYELANRVRAGDLVDAQDVAGQWYEAVVLAVHDETVLVHYAGWASRWDAKAQRGRSSVSGEVESPPGVARGRKIKAAPAPLWSQSGRWRERLQIGDAVEVRDSSSIVERPKWYSGIVVHVGGRHDTPRPLAGGATLEMHCVLTEGETPKPLLLLGRTQQILVEVEQEHVVDTMNLGRAIKPISPSWSSDDSLAPQPPALRWVNLFGEEICQLGTHLKDTLDDGPVTLRYEFDANRKPVSVMKSHPMLGSGFMREALKGTPPVPGSVGLHNLGNSCFLNSTVQCLNHIEPLKQYFLQDKYSKDLNKPNPLGSGGKVAVAYASLLKKMWCGQYSVLVPRLLKQTVASFAPQFDNSYQHDSHEFCQFLMDGLHEDLNRVKNKPDVEDLDGIGMDDERAGIESWRKHLLRHDSVIVDHCQGMHRSHLTCPQCGRESIKFDVYSCISLPIPQEKIATTIKLEDCIEKFMEAEQLDERDAYYCSSCRRHVCALKLIALWTVPDILILHMKRFTFDTSMLSGGMRRSKVDNAVQFPINGLDLTKQVLGPIDPSAPPIYNLFGVSEHSGPTANSGHYTATIRNSVDGQWYRCNDSHVGLTSGEASVTGGAYMLFYQRAKGTTKWGGLYRVMKELGIDPYGGMDPIDEEGFRKVKLKKKKKG